MTMFDCSNENATGTSTDTNAPAWLRLHHEMKSETRAQCSWDARRARHLREAETHQVWIQFGYISILEYLEREHGIEPRTASGRLRVAHALADLPMLEAELEEGTFQYSHVKELTRIMPTQARDALVGFGWIPAITNPAAAARGVRLTRWKKPSDGAHRCSVPLSNWIGERAARACWFRSPPPGTRGPEAGRLSLAGPGTLEGRGQRQHGLAGESKRQLAHWPTGLAVQVEPHAARVYAVLLVPDPGPGAPSCPHDTRTNGICDACGSCIHDVILNGACFYCGTTDIDPYAISPKKLPDVITPDRLIRKK